MASHAKFSLMSPRRTISRVCGGGDQKETEAETSPEPFELPTSMVIPHPSASACVSEMPQSVLVEVDDGEGDKV